MNSPAKLLRFLEELQDLDDQELAQALPMVSPRVVRSALAAAARFVPDNAPMLDGYLEQAGSLILTMRSDDRIAAADAPAELPAASA